MNGSDTQFNGTPFWKQNLLFTWLSQFFGMAGFCFGMPFIAFYLQDMGVTDQKELYVWLAIFNCAAPMMMAVMGPVWGTLGDKHGRKIMMLRANTAGTFVMFGMGFAGSPWGLMVFRLLQGCFTGTMSAAQALVATSAPDHKHGFALGTLQMASFSGIMAGGFLGGRCADWFGYAAAFQVGGVMVLLSTLLVLFGVKEEFKPPVLLDVDAESEIETGKPNPFWKRLPSAGDAMPILVMICAIATVRFFDRPVVPLLVQDLNGGLREGASTITGNLTALACLAAMFGGYLFGRLSDSIRPATLGKIIIVGSAVAMALLSRTQSISYLFAVRCVLSFFIIGLDPVVQVWIARVTPPDKRGSVFGWAQTARSIGWILGPLGGLYMADALSIRSVFWVEALLLTPLIFLVGKTGRAVQANGEANAETMGKIANHETTTASLEAIND